MKQTVSNYRNTWSFLAAFFLVTSLGCGINDSLLSDKTFTFPFDSANHGWQGDFVDLPVQADDRFALVYEPFKALPSELGTGNAPYIQSKNLSDDIFMYMKKQVSGLSPNTNYVAYFEVTLGTNVPANSVGIGGAPGESVYVKAGGSTIEPKGIVEKVGTVDYYRLNVDKGNQSIGGSHAVVIGNMAKPSDDQSDKYEEKVLTNDKKLVAIRSDSTGSAWVFVGTDSGFEGQTQLYIKKIMVRFE